MKYTAKDITVGTKMICKDNKDTPWWTNGKIYEVQKSILPESGLCIIDDQDSERYSEGILARLNNDSNGVNFEIVEEEKEMKYTEKDLYEGMELLCIDGGGWDFWETGEIYTVTKSELTGQLIIAGEGERSLRGTQDILGYLNGEREMRLSTIVDQKEEEKEMTKYAKITKYAGIGDADKENGLEIGKEYEIVSHFEALTDDCYIYLNEERQKYFISGTQYELVEKEGPTLKANVNVDVKEAIQAKIEQLRTDAEIISNKRNRMEWQMFMLNSKANKLEEVLETIKEFE